MEHQRNRAQGWKHAKLSGHKNEDLVKALIDEDAAYASDLLNRLGASGKSIKETSIGGLHETNVESIIPGARKTKSKTDLKIFYTDGSSNNISIKKSLGGQVYFVRAGLFIECYERHFNKSIPLNVKRAISLFWAAADDAKEIIRSYADKTNSKIYNLQLRHASLNAETLHSYNITLYNDMLQWFKENAYEIAVLSFASGAARSESEWSDHVWYINLLDENNADDIFEIKEICDAARNCADTETYYGDSNGGTTIQLPFGFVQWHQRQMQFHHSYDKVKSLVKMSRDGVHA